MSTTPTRTTAPIEARTPATPPAAITEDQQRAYTAILSAVMDAMPEAERYRVEGQLKRICDKSGENVAEYAPARVIPAARLALVSLYRGGTPRQAMAAAGLDISRDWGVITAANMADPRFRAAWTAATHAIGHRIAAKSLAVVEGAMDGETVDRQTARLAMWSLERMGDFGQVDMSRTPGQRTETTTAAAQVVINLGGDRDMSACCNLLQGQAGGVING